ncbi:uncharacterized protein LOC126903867 [Daktulosphaira vitifoliae]|uniref:uncharacterized protein LOC126903867 n=1 Tax=Daktulosphaira vitifoliae TaxID=58002 RepID=UPI0021AAD768|nr:uncharacterized protein LOC126903867 [Daktulosphaira vitifoliae]
MDKNIEKPQNNELVTIRDPTDNLSEQERELAILRKRIAVLEGLNANNGTLGEPSTSKETATSTNADQESQDQLGAVADKIEDLKLRPSDNRIQFTQINLHHSKGASSVLLRTLTESHTTHLQIALIQEPWINGDQIMGLNLRNFKLFHKQADKPRTCILVNNKVKASLIFNLSSADLTIIKVTLNYGKNIIVASGYLPYEVTNPGRSLPGFFNYRKNEKLELILGMDAKAHHTIWGSSNINQRGEVIMDLLPTTDLSILNRSSEPTFVIRNRQEVIDSLLKRVTS